MLLGCEKKKSEIPCVVKGISGSGNGTSFLYEARATLGASCVVPVATPRVSFTVGTPCTSCIESAYFAQDTGCVLRYAPFTNSIFFVLKASRVAFLDRLCRYSVFHTGMSVGSYEGDPRSPVCPFVISKQFSKIEQK